MQAVLYVWIGAMKGEMEYGTVWMDGGGGNVMPRYVEEGGGWNMQGLIDAVRVTVQ